MTVNISSYAFANNLIYPAKVSVASNNESRVANQNQQSKNQSVQQQEVKALKKQDQTVRNHEQAHINAAAGIAVSPPHFSYTTGPDGKQYISGGEVSIDVSPIPNDPQATIRKAETIRRAALAPSSPSSQDNNVAAQATVMANKARIELLQQNTARSGITINVQA